MLDMLCLTGRGRLGAPLAGAGRGARCRLVPATPIALFLREHAEAWRAVRAGSDDAAPPSAAERRGARASSSMLRHARRVVLPRARAACQLDEAEQLRRRSASWSPRARDSDGFAGLRALVWAARGRPAPARWRSSFAGRWTRQSPRRRRRPPRRGASKLQAWSLLRRYGVVFRRLLDARDQRRAVARARARLPPARGARRDPRRPVRDRHVGRAVRAARRGRTPARGPAHPADGALVSDQRAPIR